MNIQGRHAIANGRPKWRGYITPHGTLQIDCDEYPEFWMTISLDQSEIDQLQNYEPDEKGDE